MSEIIASGTIGDVQMICVNLAWPDYRPSPDIDAKAMPYGATLSIALIGVGFANFIFKEKPEKIIAHATLLPQGKSLHTS